MSTSGAPVARVLALCRRAVRSYLEMEIAAGRRPGHEDVKRALHGCADSFSPEDLLSCRQVIDHLVISEMVAYGLIGPP